MATRLYHPRAVATLILALALGAGACGDGAVAPNGSSSLAIVLEGDGSLALNPGESAVLLAFAVRSGDFKGAVTLSVTGAPAGVTVSLVPQTLAAAEHQAALHVSVGQPTSPGTYALTVHGQGEGASATATLQLTVGGDGGGGGTTTLTSGVPVTGISGIDGSERLYRIVVPAGATRLTVTTTGPGDDVDLYVKGGAAPTPSVYECASETLSSDETCIVDGPAPGEWFILLTAWSDYSGVTLTATVSVAGAAIAFTQLASSWHHTCGLDAGGRAYCWGNGFNGALGNGGQDTKLVPTAVAGGLTFTRVATGNNHSCGLTPGGQAYCWGNNNAGKLGDGTTTQRLTPTPVIGGLTFGAIAAGDGHSCALTTSGVPYCWGDGINGAVGDGTYENRLAPYPVAGGHTFEKIFAGGPRTCALKIGGAAYCWGVNTWGELGTGNTTPYRVPTAVVGGHAFASIRPGGGHTCGVTTSGAAYCWGSNAYGQIGDGTQTYRMEGPEPVSGGLTFAAIATGSDHTCAVTTAGAAYCWGTPTVSGSSSGYQLTPRAVTGGHTFGTVTAGQQFSCAVTTAGPAYCWGANGNGKLGDGGSATGFQPTPVAAPSP